MTCRIVNLAERRKVVPLNGYRVLHGGAMTETRPLRRRPSRFWRSLLILAAILIATGLVGYTIIGRSLL